MRERVADVICRDSAATNVSRWSRPRSVASASGYPALVTRAGKALRRAGRVRRTTWHERAAVAQALVYVAAVDLALRMRGFRWLSPRLRSADGNQDAGALKRARTMARAIDRASQLYPAHAECLHRAAALQLWLRRSGVPSNFRIGVRKDGDDLRAHAWVEVAGAPLIDSPATIAPFTPIYAAAESYVSRRGGGTRVEAGL